MNYEACARAYELSIEDVVLIKYEMALGAKLSGMVEPGINAYSLADWKLGRTYQEIGEECGTSITAVHQWVVGHCMVSAPLIRVFARALGKSEASVAVASWKAWQKYRLKRGVKTNEG